MRAWIGRAAVTSPVYLKNNVRITCIASRRRESDRRAAQIELVLLHQYHRQAVNSLSSRRGADYLSY